MRWPTMASFIPPTPATAKAGKPHRDLAEKRRDRMVSVILHSANLATASAVRPPNGVALGLRRDDLLLEAGQQQLPFGQGQPEVGDITEIIGSVDLHDVDGLFLTVSRGFHQPHNPSHAPTPGQKTDTKLSLHRPHPQSPGSPEYMALGIDRFILSGYPHLEECYRFAELVFPLLPLKPTTGNDRGPARNAGPFGEIVANAVTPAGLQRPG